MFFCKFSELSLWNNLTWSLNMVFSSFPSHYFSHCSSSWFIQTIKKKNLPVDLHARLVFFPYKAWVPTWVGIFSICSEEFDKWLNLQPLVVILCQGSVKKHNKFSHNCLQKCLGTASFYPLNNTPDPAKCVSRHVGEWRNSEIMVLLWKYSAPLVLNKVLGL